MTLAVVVVLKVEHETKLKTSETRAIKTPACSGGKSEKNKRKTSQRHTPNEKKQKAVLAKITENKSTASTLNKISAISLCRNWTSPPPLRLSLVALCIRITVTSDQCGLASPGPPTPPGTQILLVHPSTCKTIILTPSNHHVRIHQPS